MIKFRELVHAGDQAGVPANLKAVEKIETASKRKQPKQPKKRKKRVVVTTRIEQITQYAKEHGNVIEDTQDLADHLGYAQKLGAVQTLRYMARQGLVKPTGTYIDRTWALVDKRDDLPKGDKMNGPVSSYSQPLPTPSSDSKPVVVAEAQTEAATPPAEPTQEEKTQAKVKHSIEHAKFDHLIWEYVKAENHTLTEIETLIEFSKWLEEEHDTI